MGEAQNTGRWFLNSGVSRISNSCCLLHWLNSSLWIKSCEIQYLPQETCLGLSHRFHMHRIHAASKDNSMLTEGGAGITGLLSLCKQYRYHSLLLYYSIGSSKSTEFSLPQGYCFSERLTQWLVFICWDKLHKKKKIHIISPHRHKDDILLPICLPGNHLETISIPQSIGIPPMH